LCCFHKDISSTSAMGSALQQPTCNHEHSCLQVQQPPRQPAKVHFRVPHRRHRGQSQQGEMKGISGSVQWLWSVRGWRWVNGSGDQLGLKQADGRPVHLGALVLILWSDCMLLQLHCKCMFCRLHMFHPTAKQCCYIRMFVAGSDSSCL